MAEDQAEKVRENRLRRMADRQGLKLQRSRRRDTRAVDYGMYYLAQIDGNAAHWRGRLLVSPEQGLTLDEVEDYLTGEKEE